MALPALLNGAECGPSNPLQSLSKRFDADRGIQQDYFGAGRAAPSKDAFHSQSAAPTARDHDAARFFGPQVSMPPQPSFAMRSLAEALPAVQRPDSARSSSWAADFLINQPVAGPALAEPQIRAQLSALPQPLVSASSEKKLWDHEFLSRETLLEAFTSAPESIPTVVSHEQSDAQAAMKAAPSMESDELARVAARLVDTVKDEKNPKFKQSVFMGLMQQLRDHEVVVDGDDMVPADYASGAQEAVSQPRQPRIDIKGKGRASPPWSFTPASLMTPGATFTLPSPDAWLQDKPGESSSTAVRSEQEQVAADQEMENDAYFERENAHYMEYWREREFAAAQRAQQPMRAANEWDHLQATWDEFEATANGIVPVVAPYEFQSHNPYVLGDSSTHHHEMHTGRRQSFIDSVLELEAAVQHDPKDAGAWFDLGVKHQENEREQKAMQALHRAISLDPSHLPAWLALAVSYANEGNRDGTCYALSQWVDHNARFAEVVRQHHTLNPQSEDATLQMQVDDLAQTLIAMARSDADIDADIQIALGVLLNTSEDYSKSQDCFAAALSVRPDDWLLYNRVGATLANMGKAEESLAYYYKALELNPMYIRARYNAGISCSQLRRYEEAARHILDALILQNNDGSRDKDEDAKSGLDGSGGVTSQALWDSLKIACLHLQRLDLATLCDKRDVDGV
ncbi:TPR-like protein [Fistulina hepatica ATCC 64428]|uniref:TPR-like protein n=1 Tax=Fistulina hepatica ATCC 64428 TaxID=1128425 RepID=A0A0D7A281_9AGAR|nr:TPR-like protein [Fistulina hepatica ATCC 64428]